MISLETHQFILMFEYMLLADGVSIWVFFPLVLVVYYFLTTAGRLRKAEAVKLLKEGAVLVDVRTTEEYNQQYVDGAVNVPLQNLATGAKKHLKDKSQPLLCFCLSGARSNSAVGQLKRLGYTAHNIGTAGRARSIVDMANSE